MEANAHDAGVVQLPGIAGVVEVVVFKEIINYYRSRAGTPFEKKP